MRRGGRRPGAGRPAGVPNKLSAGIKDAINNAFVAVGGERYLEKVARENPAVFCGLLGKILPTELANADGGPLVVQLLSFAESKNDPPPQ